MNRGRGCCAHIIARIANNEYCVPRGCCPCKHVYGTEAGWVQENDVGDGSRGTLLWKEAALLYPLGPKWSDGATRAVTTAVSLSQICINAINI